MRAEYIGVVLKIKLGMEIPRIVMLHEVPLLQQFYGETKVDVSPKSLEHVRGRRLVDGKPLELDAYAEYQRLTAKYKSKEPGEPSLMVAAFVSPEHMEKYVEEHSIDKDSPVVEEEADGTSNKTAIDKAQRRADVFRALEERNIPFSKNTRTDRLEAKLKDVLAQEQKESDAA